jgi:hypothetical protein
MFNALVLSILFLLLLSLPAAASDQTRSNMDPIIILSLDRDSAEVEVSPGSSGSVHFNLTVECELPADLPENATCMVNLTAYAWWNVTEITIMDFTGNGGIRNIEIRVDVPINTSAEADHDLAITGGWSYRNLSLSGSLQSISASIDVLPFYDLRIGSNEPVKYARVGDRATFPFHMTNRANGDVNVTLLIKRDSRVIEYWLDEQNTFLKKGETKSFNITFRQTPSASRRNDLHLTAVIDEESEGTEYVLDMELRTDPTLSTFFYEKNFIFLVSVIGVISLVAGVLYIRERVHGRHDLDPSQDEELEDKN